jgi:hypothetical protein
MNLTAFTKSLEAGSPDKYLSPCLKALWFDGKEQWDQAHLVAQEIQDHNGAWIHAYLHRKEGDISNAQYWYSRAGKPMPDYALKQEWEELVTAFLKS